jgi:hypothetical protein
MLLHTLRSPRVGGIGRGGNSALWRVFPHPFPLRHVFSGRASPTSQRPNGRPDLPDPLIRSVQRLVETALREQRRE